MKPIDIQCPKCGKPAGVECLSPSPAPGLHRSRFELAGRGLDVMLHCTFCGAKPGQVCWGSVLVAIWPHKPRVNAAAYSVVAQMVAETEVTIRQRHNDPNN